MDAIRIVRATLEDVEGLREISIQTFRETFAELNTEENMQGYVKEHLSLERLTEEMNARESAFYFAMDGDKVVGYLKVNFGGAQTELKDENGLEIERIYVVKDYLGKKVGKLLFDQAVEIAKDKDMQYIWLGVWEENARAINFYKKQGFVAFDQHIFRLGEDEQTDIMMKLLLK